MKDYPLYDVEDCESYVKFLIKISTEYSESIAFEDKGNSWSYSEVANAILSACGFFKQYKRQNIVVDVKNPMLFCVAYFSVVITDNVAILASDDHSLYSDIEWIEYINDAEIMRILKLHTCLSVALEDYVGYTNTEELSTVVFSSGTTSVVHAVMLSQINLLSDTIAGMRLYEYKRKKRYFNVLPYSHLFGVVADLLGPLYSGGTICFSDNTIDFFNNLRFFKPTNLNLPPILVSAIHKMLIKTKDFKKVTGGKLEKIMCAGAKMDDKVNSDFGQYGLYAYAAYGLTECSPCISMNRDLSSKSGSVGKVLPCCKVKIVNGEIVVRGINVMLGYYGNWQLTEKVIHDGWLHTGDLGYLDGDGYLFLTGRLSNIIIFEDGTKLSPEYLEERIVSETDVLECLIQTKEGNKSRMTIRAVVENDDVNRVRDDIYAICDEMNVLSKVANLVISEECLMRNKLGKIIRNQ